MHIVNCPALPYWGHIPDGVHPGTVIQIDGHVEHHCDKFEINILADHNFGHHHNGNIALQIKAKASKGKLTLNSRHHGHWGHKEKHHGISHVHHGSHFNLVIVAEHNSFSVMANGHHVCTYHHRIPIHEIRGINIEGHVTIQKIEFRHGNHVNIIPSAPITTVVVDGGHHGHHDSHHGGLLHNVSHALSGHHDSRHGQHGHHGGLLHNVSHGLFGHHDSHHGNHGHHGHHGHH